MKAFHKYGFTTIMASDTELMIEHAGDIAHREEDINRALTTCGYPTIAVLEQQSKYIYCEADDPETGYYCLTFVKG